MKYVSPLALLLLALPTFAQGKVIVVGPAAGPGIDETSLQAAIDLAVDGDTILVKPGSYAQGFAIDAKALTIVADDGTKPVFDQAGSVVNLGPTQRVVIQGLRVELSALNAVPLSLTDNAGQVWLEDVEASALTFQSINPEGIYVGNSASVVLLRVTALGGILLPFLNAGGGLNAVNSRISAYDSTFTGVDGTIAVCVPGFPADGQDGSPGATLQNTFLFASGSTFQGGAGGGLSVAACGSCPLLSPGDGGPGLVMTGAGTLVYTLETQLLGGSAGLSAPTCAGGAGGPGSLGGALVPLSGSGLGLTASSPVRELGTLNVTLEGPAGSPAFLAIALDSTDAFLPGFKGTLLVSASGPPIGLGPLPPSGVLDLALPVPSLPPGFESLVLFGQSAFLDAASLTVLGAPAAVVVLDSAF